MLNLVLRLIRRRPIHEPWVDENGLHIVSAFSHNGTGEVRAYVQTFNGHDLAHVRHFIRAKDGLARPTKKGIAVDVGELPKLAAAIDALLAAAGGRR